MLFQVRKKNPKSRVNLHYNKLYVDSTVYIYNEERDMVEMINNIPDQEDQDQVSHWWTYQFWELFYKRIENSGKQLEA